MKVGDVLFAYQGIIGTLLGVITTLIMSEWLKKTGKIHASVRNYKVSYCVMDYSGEHYYVNTYDPEHVLEEYQHGKLEIELALFNSSNEHKGLKNVIICLLDGKGRRLLECVPNDEKASKFSSGAHRSDGVKVINLPPKIMIHFDLYIIVSKNNIDELKKCRKVSLELEDHRDRKKRIIIIKDLTL